MKAHDLCVVACMVIGGTSAGCVAEGGGDGEQGRDPDPTESEVDSSLIGSQLLGEWNYDYLSPLGGLSRNVVQGTGCSFGRDRAYFTVERSIGSGHCDSLGWYSNDPKDCQVWIHVGTGVAEHGRCTTRIHENLANVVIFEHRDFGGNSKRFDPGRYDIGALGIGNDQLSSIWVPPGWSATLYWDAGFQGAAKTLTADSPYIGDAWNDQTSSLVVVRGPLGPN